MDDNFDADDGTGCLVAMGVVLCLWLHLVLK